MRYLQKNFDITFNCKKNSLYKICSKLIGCEHVYLNDKKINQIKHLENDTVRNLYDSIGCTHRTSIFIGQVKNLYANFGYLQMSVLVCLFKTYCCTLYGSQMWQVNSQKTINSVCTSWNKGVRRILNLPCHHTRLLGLLLKQSYIKQDAREAMRVVFSVLTKRICMHKTNFLRIYSNIVLKLY